jgi:membrane-bound metal-dependent hydrolase YbcI (DUF457 family)
MAAWALGQAGLKTRTRKGLAALILGANMPDIDVFFFQVPWEPLAMHRGFTHGIGGLVVQPFILAGLLGLLDRWQVKRGKEFKSGLAMRWRWLLALSFIGVLSHPLLDALTTYSVQLLSPFSTTWFRIEALFIIDVWLWLLLAGGIFWSKRLEKRGGDWRFPARAALGIAQLPGPSFGPSMGGRSPGRGHFRFSAAHCVVAARARLARRRLLPPERLRSTVRNGSGGRMRAHQHGRSAGARGAPEKARPL